ncbi:MAG: hypothetical protein K6G15_09400 [Desulfovibrio sp.]|nr:hypothetical protein [Desulfovibrio sp.]
MSQTRIESNEIAHYRENSLEPPKMSQAAPKAFENAQPLPKSSSAWKLAGRIALGILTLGTSELLRLAWKGIASCVANASPARRREPQLQGRDGLPAAAPDADQANTVLKAMLTSSSKSKPSAAYQEAVNTVLNDLREKYGEALVPQGSLGEILKSIDPKAQQHLYRLINNADHALTPKELHDTIKNYLLPSLNKATFVSYVKSALDKQGGLDDISSEALAKKFLGKPGQKNWKELEKSESRADVEKLCLKMEVRKTIADIKAGMLEAIQEARDTFGDDIFPEDFDHILHLRTKSDTLVCDDFNEHLQSDPQLRATKQDMKELFRSILLEAM